MNQDSLTEKIHKVVSGWVLSSGSSIIYLENKIKNQLLRYSEQSFPLMYISIFFFLFFFFQFRI